MKSVAAARARSTCASPSTSRRTAIPESYVGASLDVLASPRKCSRSRAATSAGPRPGPGARRPRATTATGAYDRRRSRGAGRAGWRRPRCRRPRAPAAAISVSRSRTSNVRERVADLDVALVVGVVQRVQQRGAAVGLALDEAGREPALGRTLTSTGVPDSGDLARSARPRSPTSPIARRCRAGPRPRPGRGCRGAAAARPRRRRSRRRRRTARRGSPALLLDVVDDQRSTPVGELGHREGLLADTAGCGRGRAGPRRDVEGVGEAGGARGPQRGGRGARATDRAPAAAARRGARRRSSARR